MGNLVISGGKKLSGSISVNTSKNAAVALICAALLNRGTTRLMNVPKIEEVNRLIEVLSSIGVLVKWFGSRNLEILPPKNFKLQHINYQSAVKTRGIIFLLGTLIHFQKFYRVPQAGGCRLGERTVRPHFYALAEFGVKIKTLNRYYQISVKDLQPAKNLILYESGDTVTENAIMAAALIPGKTKIKFASANYQVQDLCYFLTKLGIKIKGIGTTTLEIEGKRRIDKDIKYYLTEDPIEAMLFLSIAATTNSSITILRCPIDFLELELLKLEKMGFKYKILKRYKAKNGKSRLADIKTFKSTLVALEEKISTQSYPGLNIDNLPFFAPIATQARGTTLIFDWVYEERAIYFTELNKLGAKVVLADPHRVYITGPTALKANEVICPPALRPAAILIPAMLSAKGESILRNVYSIERGYEDICQRLAKLGAKINKIE